MHPGFREPKPFTRTDLDMKTVFARSKARVIGYGIKEGGDPWTIEAQTEDRLLRDFFLGQPCAQPVIGGGNFLVRRKREGGGEFSTLQGIAPVQGQENLPSGCCRSWN